MIRKYTFSFLTLFSLFVFFSAFYGLEMVWADPVVATISVGSQPQDVAYDSDNREMYVTNGGSNIVSVINTSNHTVIATIPVGIGPVGVAYDIDNRDVCS